MEGAKPAPTAQEQAAAEALRSEPEDNFKLFVLYMKPGDANSEKAVALLKKSPRLAQTVIQDATLVPLPRPAWLVSVPTLVDKHEQVVKRGSEALKQLADWALLAPPTSVKQSPKGYKSGKSAFVLPDE